MNRSSQGVGFAPSLRGLLTVRRQPRGPVVGTGLGMLLILMLLVALGGIQGCAQLGIAQPQGFNERLAAGYSSVTGVREATLALLTAKSITAGEAQKIQDKCDEARKGLDTASTLKGVDFKSAENRLTAATQLIIALQSFVVDRKNGVQTPVPQ